MDYYSESFSLKRGYLVHEGQDVHFTDSPNHSSNIDPKFLILHYTAGPSLDSAIRWFSNPRSKASAHFSIDYDGRIVQSVKTTRKAWHCGKSSYGRYVGLNSHSLGIEIVNPGHMEILPNGKYKAWYGEVFEVNGDGHTTVIDSNGGVHETRIIEASHPTMGGRKYGWIEATESQIKSTVEIGTFLFDQFGMKRCLPHQDISRGRKWDTGPTIPTNVFSLIEGRTGGASGMYEVSVNSYLNMRDEPSMNGNAIAKIANGTFVEKVNSSGVWFDVVTEKEGMRGWVHSNFLNEV